jgi:hypothetical protein
MATDVPAPPMAPGIGVPPVGVPGATLVASGVVSGLDFVHQSKYSARAHTRSQSLGAQLLQLPSSE